MRRFQTLLFVAGLAAAPTSALAGPSDTRNDDRTFDIFEWSMAKGRLGIMLMGLTPELREHFGATSTTGLLVARVDAGSPAAKAGVRVGDVLTTTNDQSVDDANDVRGVIAATKKGDTVRLGVIRDGKPLRLDAVLTDAPASSPEAFWPRSWLRNFMKSFDELEKRPTNT